MMIYDALQNAPNAMNNSVGYPHQLINTFLLQFENIYSIIIITLIGNICKFYNHNLKV